MKRNTLNSILITATIGLIFACKPKKIIVAPPAPTPSPVVVVPDRKAENLASIKAKDLNFNTLSLKGKANLTIKGEENSVTMLIRMQKDKKIWVSVTAVLGVEVARAVITPDSVLLRNNLDKTYLKKPFSYIYSFTNPQVDFSLLQAVFSGNTIPKLMTLKSDLKQQDGSWLLSGNLNNLTYQTLFNTLLKSSETTLNDARNGQAFKVNYGGYTPINNGVFPSGMKISTLSGTKKLDASIEFNKIDVNVAVDFPFSVPKSYELIR